MLTPLFSDSSLEAGYLQHYAQGIDSGGTDQPIQGLDLLKTSLQAQEFMLMPLKVKHSHSFVQLEGAFVYGNGRPLQVPASYKDAFLRIANQNADFVFFQSREHGNQVLLRCHANFIPGVPNPAKIAQCAEYIQKRLPHLRQALQCVGLVKKCNKTGLRLTRLQLETQKEFANILAANSAKDSLVQQQPATEQAKAVVRIKKVEQNPQQSPEAEIKNGGYFKVAKKSSIVTTMSGQEQNMELAWKTARHEHSCPVVSSSKISKEIQLVQRILSRKYLLTYYVNQQEPGSVYMQYMPSALKQHIHNKQLSFQQLLNYAQQIVQAVGILHNSSVVHRDLKPDNILVSETGIKIIDFAESTTTAQPFNQKHTLGCTFPYSPLECLLGKEEGFNKPEIDLWSVGMILYEMVFKNIPLFYSRWIGLEFLEKWRNSTQMSLFPLYRKRRGLARAQSLISAATVYGVQVNPEKRLSLRTYSSMLAQMRRFYNRVVSV